MNLLESKNQLASLMEYCLETAKKNGATACEAALNIEQGLEVNVRLQSVDQLIFRQDKNFNIEVYIGQKKGSASSSDFSHEALKATIQKACSIANYTDADPCHGLPEKELLAWDYPDLELYYPWSISPEEAITLAQASEQAGLSFDKRITNSEGVSVSTSQGLHFLGNSLGFRGSYPSSCHSTSACFIAQEGENKERSHEYTVHRNPSQLINCEKIALQAAEKTVARLSARTLKSAKVPVIFSKEVARGLLGHFIAAISGSNLYKETSFLLNHLEQKIFPDFMSIEENAYLPGALASSPFDAEGVKPQNRALIERGYLRSYILSSYSARKLGMKTTGNAGGIHNLLVSHSDLSLQGLIRKMHKGILITELMGQGVDIVTGDYSRGAAGFWVENGEIAYPIHEFTVAGNLKEIFQGIVAIANDVDQRGAIQVGSILVDNMTVAGGSNE